MLKNAVVATIWAGLLFINSPALALKVCQVAPAKVRLSIPPGEAKSGTITVDNTSSETVRVKVYAEDWFYLPGGSGSKEFKPAGTLPFSCANWITVSPTEFTVSPLGTQTVNFVVKVPKEAIGGYYATLFFEQTWGEKGQQEEGVSVAVVVRVASLFYIEPEGTIKRQAELDELSVQNTTNGLIIKGLFKNIGNVDITARGTFDIIDKEGIVQARGTFSPVDVPDSKDVYTLPNDKVNVEGRWKKMLGPGNYDIILTIDLSTGAVLVKEAVLVISQNGNIDVNIKD